MNRTSQSTKTQTLPPPLIGPRGGPMGMFREPEKSKNTRATLIRLWGYIRRQLWILIGISVLVVLTSIANLLGPFLMGQAIDIYIQTGDLAGLGRMLLWMLVTYILGSAGTWLQTYLMAGVAQYAVRDLRDDLFSAGGKGVAEVGGDGKVWHSRGGWFGAGGRCRRGLVVGYCGWLARCLV